MRRGHEVDTLHEDSLYGLRRRTAVARADLKRLARRREIATRGRNELLQRVKALRAEHSEAATKELRLKSVLESSRQDLREAARQRALATRRETDAIIADRSTDEGFDVAAAVVRIEERLEDAHGRRRDTAVALNAAGFATVTVRCAPPGTLMDDGSRSSDAINASAVFLVPPEYSFSSLLNDAVQRFGLGAVAGTASLRDEADVIWGATLNVRTALAQLPSQTELQSIVRLVFTRAAAALDDAAAGSREQESASAAASAAEAEREQLYGGGGEQLDSETMALLGSTSQHGRVPLARSLHFFANSVEKMREMHVLSDTPIFFQPRWEATLPYAAEEMRTYSARIRSAKHKNIRLMRLLALFHGIFIAALTTSLLLRTQMESAGQLAAWTQRALVTRPFAVDIGAGSHRDSVSFVSMQTVDHVWAWLNGPLLELDKSTTTTSACTPTTCDNQYMWNLGSVRLQQYRTHIDSCRYVRRYTSILRQWGCFGKWTPFSQGFNHGQDSVYNETSSDSVMGTRLDMVNTMNPLATVASDQGHDGFTWYDEMPRSSRFETHRTTLGNSGFPLDLPPSKSAAKAKLWSLEREGWIDRATRALTVDLNLVSPNTNLILVLHFTIELTLQGAISSSYTIAMLQFSVYNYATGVTFATMLLCDIYAVLYALATATYSFSSIWRYGFPRFATSIWSVIDAGTCGLLVTQFVIVAFFEFWWTRPYDMHLPHFDNMRDIAGVRFICIVLQSVSLLLSTVSLVQYLQLNDSARRILRTLGGAAPSIAVAFALFGAAQVTFGAVLYFLWGAVSEDFGGMWKSVATTFFMLGGRLDLDTLIKADRTAAYVFLSVFTVTNILLFPALFAAIINNSYSIVATAEVSDTTRRDDPGGYWRRCLFGKILLLSVLFASPLKVNTTPSFALPPSFSLLQLDARCRLCLAQIQNPPPCLLPLSSSPLLLIMAHLLPPPPPPQTSAAGSGRKQAGRQSESPSPTPPLLEIFGGHDARGRRRGNGRQPLLLATAPEHIEDPPARGRCGIAKHRGASALLLRWCGLRSGGHEHALQKPRHRSGRNGRLLLLHRRGTRRRGSREHALQQARHARRRRPLRRSVRTERSARNGRCCVLRLWRRLWHARAKGVEIERYHVWLSPRRVPGLRRAQVLKEAVVFAAAAAAVALLVVATTSTTTTTLISAAAALTVVRARVLLITPLRELIRHRALRTAPPVRCDHFGLRALPPLVARAFLRLLYRRLRLRTLTLRTILVTRCCLKIIAAALLLRLLPLLLA